MALEKIGTTKNGKDVYADPENSHVTLHLMVTPGLLDLVKEALPMIDATEERVRVECEMGRVIGKTEQVEVDDDDEIVYAIRKDRDSYVKFVKNREPVSCTKLTVALDKLDNGYMLWSAWIGPRGVSFPGSENATPESYEYWKNKALVWGIQEVIPETVTSICPWN